MVCLAVDIHPCYSIEAIPTTTKNVQKQSFVFVFSAIAIAIDLLRVSIHRVFAQINQYLSEVQSKYKSLLSSCTRKIRQILLGFKREKTVQQIACHDRHFYAF